MMTARPNALILCFFPAFTPPSSGGELRLGGLYRAFAQKYDVTLLTSTHFGARFEEIDHGPGFRELRFPKDELWRKAYATLERSGVSGDLSGLAFALAVADPSCALRRAARELAASSDVIIHEFPYSEPIFDDGDWPPEIYNAHNVEAGLLSSIARGPGFWGAFQKLLRLEGNLVRRARQVFATSATDAEIFRLLYGADAGRLAVCANGFAEEEFAQAAEERLAANDEKIARPRLLFTGSAHFPNVEAAAYIIKIAPDLPECDFIVAGGVCGAIADWRLPANVLSIGPFSPKQKRDLFREADLYLNPLALGSGTSLKAVESLACAIPTIATPEGGRGLGLVCGVHAEIVSREDMPAAIRALAQDAARRAKMGAAGREHALSRFTWRRIADDLAAAIDNCEPAPPSSRPFILALNDYPVDQLRSGGAMRIRMLLGNLGYDVALLTFGAACEIVLLDEGVLQITIPKTDEHRAFEDAVNKDQPISVNDGVASLFVTASPSLLEVAATLASRAQAVIFEHPYMAPTLDVIQSVRPGLPVVYSAHNFESRHKEQLLQGHPLAGPLLSFIRELEARLVERSDLIICCSQADARHFGKAKAPVIVTANGCSLPESPGEIARETPGSAQDKRAGFLGSSHPPNVAAAQFILDELAPKFPDVRFEFIGGVCDALPPNPRENVVLHGVLPDRAKSEVMRQWDLGLNPVESGGGSSLKLPDYMAHGRATLNTATGARSFEVEENAAGRVVDLADFAANLDEMLSDAAQLATLGANAYAYAEQRLAWPSVTAPYRDALKALLSPPRDARRRLLVVTYRYTEPPLGGAEEYLIEVLKRLRRRFDQIDLAAVDVERIGDMHHFGCEMSDSGGATQRMGGLFDRSFYFPSDELAEADMLAKCRDLERAWASEEFDVLTTPFTTDLAAGDAVRLLSGFFGPEVHGGVTRRWTAPVFSFLLPSDARVFRMSGFAAAEKKLILTLIGLQPNGHAVPLARSEQKIGPHFDINLALPAAHGTFLPLLYCQTDEHWAANDHRPFGILLESASVQRDGGKGANGRPGLAPLETHAADLSEQLADHLRRDKLAAWVDALRRTALRRKPEMDAAFAAVRGPHSPAMQAWLGEHGGGYDVVLVQGIPFDVIPSTVETLAKLPKRPRIVTLPHFHGDDRFYHWRRYFQAFAAADTTLLFSPFLASRLGESGKFAIVPGGGVRADDLGGPDAEKAFRAIHASANPFFLVLGRKTGSKGYEQAIRAHQTLRQTRPDIDLLLIGADDDGRPVHGDGVFYLGRQKREIVRGALAACLGLVTMSQSESFGIVLCEAWLFGKPVIANANCYSFRDLVKHGKTGLLVNSEAGLATAMRRLGGDEKLRRRMGRAGFDETIEKYSWERVAEAVAAELAG
jgi:glycosyltransferase involved in cell wall biosynthesis